VTLAACSGNSDFIQLQTEITRFEGVAFFLLITFYCHKYLEERSTNAGTQAIFRSSVMPVQRAVCDAGGMFKE